MKWIYNFTKSFLKIDRDIFQTLVYRGWTTVSGVLMLVTIPYWLSPTEQGFFYLFYSIIGLQVFFELGLNQIVMHRLSASFGKLYLADNALLIGSQLDLGEFQNIVKSTKIWYRNIAFWFYMVSLLLGSYFLINSEEQGAHDALPILAILLVFVALNIKFSIELTARQATSRVAEVAKLRTIQSIIGYAILLSLVFGLDAGLMAIWSLSFTSCFCTYVWLRKTKYRYSVEPINLNPVKWKADYFPLQWRLSFSWISGYLVSQFLILYVFEEYGSVKAGEYGITMSVFSSILALGLAICVAKIPEVATLLSLGSNKMAFTLFRKLLIKALVLVITISATFIAVVMYFYSDLTFITERMLGPKLLVLFALVTIANTLIMAIAAYLRAHDREPVLRLSVTLAVLVVLNLALSTGESLEFVMVIHTLIHVFVGIPWILWLLNSQFKSYGFRDSPS